MSLHHSKVYFHTSLHDVVFCVIRFKGVRSVWGYRQLILNVDKKASPSGSVVKIK